MLTTKNSKNSKQKQGARQEVDKVELVLTKFLCRLPASWAIAARSKGKRSKGTRLKAPGGSFGIVEEVGHKQYAGYHRRYNLSGDKKDSQSASKHPGTVPDARNQCDPEQHQQW